MIRHFVLIFASRSWHIPNFTVSSFLAQGYRALEFESSMNVEMEPQFTDISAKYAVRLEQSNNLVALQKDWNNFVR